MPNGSYIVAPKRNHCIAKYGKFIVSFGGINDLGRVLEDIDIYDTEFGNWQSVQLKNKIEGVWYGTCSAVYYPDRYDENLSKIEIDYLPTPNWGRVEHLIKEEGIYLFGGRNRKSEVLGTLYILKLGNKKNKNYWIEPQTTGQGPCHRYQHTMVNLVKKNMLIIHGGRTSTWVKRIQEGKIGSFIKVDNSPDSDKNIKLKIKNSFTLSDLWALKLDQLEWIRITVNEESKIIRTNHWLGAINDSTLFIFGGNGANSMYSNQECLVSLCYNKQNKSKLNDSVS